MNQKKPSIVLELVRIAAAIAAATVSLVAPNRDAAAARQRRARAHQAAWG